MATGFDRPKFDMTLSAMPRTSTPQPQGKGFWTDQISTGGGIAGALGGAAGGAALGSVVPGVGTAIGGILGALLGGAGGSAGGEIAENAITGDDIWKNVGQEALIGGVTSLPIGAGLKLARAGVKAGTGLGKTAASDLVQEAGVQTIGKGTVRRMGANGTLDQNAQDAILRLQTPRTAGKTSMSGRLAASGDRALASQYGVLSAPTRRQTNPTETVSELARIGITKPADAERIAGQITGGSGILNQAVAKAVGGAGQVDTSTLRRVFTDAMDNAGLVDKDRKSLQTLFDAQMNKLSGGARGSLSPNVNPTEVLDTMKALEKRIANLRGKGGNYRMTTPEREDMASVLQLVRDEMEDQLYRNAGGNANLAKVLTPELREKLIALQPNNPQWAKHVDENIMTATDIGALRSAQRPFVNIGKIIDEGEDAAFSVGGRIATSAGGIRDTLMQAGANMVRNPAARAYSAGTRAASGGAPAAVGQGIIPLTARQGFGRALAPGDDATAMGQEVSTLDALSGAQDPQAGQQFTSMLGVEDPTLTQDNGLGFSSAELGQALMAALAAGDQPAAEQLSQMYELAALLEEAQAPALSNLSQSNQSALASADNATNTVNQLEQLFAQAGGGSGRLGGLVQNVNANVGFDKNANIYNSLSQASVTQIAKALAGPGAGTVSDADARVIIAALPTLTDSPEEAQAKFAALRQRLEAAKQNTLLYGAGGTATDTASALGAY